MSGLFGGFHPGAFAARCGVCAPLGIPPFLNVPIVQKKTVLRAVPVQSLAQRVVAVPVTQEALVRVPVQCIQKVPVTVPVTCLQAVPVQVPVCVNLTFAPVAANPCVCPPGAAALDP